MITSIKSIDNFGVYKKFNWTGDINDFKERNIIYGWNYSGKTTLSRIFTSLRDKEMHTDFKHSDFCIVRESGEEITCKDIQESDVLVQVFNSEYIQENLKWETNEDLEGILFEVGEAGTIRTQIEEKEECVKEIAERKKIWLANIKNFELFDKEGFSREAREIKRNHFNNLIDFDKRHLRSIADKITVDNFSNFIISDDSKLKSIQAGARETNPGERLAEIEFKYSIDEIIDEVKAALSEVPDKAKVIKILEENQDLYRWVNEGKSLHKGKRLEICSFCDNPITNERIEELNNYYSNQSGLLLERIERIKERIQLFEDELIKYNLKYSKNDFIERFQSAHDEAIRKLKIHKKDYTNLLEGLKGDLDKKVNEARYRDLKPSNYNIEIVEKFDTMIQEVNQNIKNHNNYVDNFSEIQKEDRRYFQEHLVSSFLLREGYFKIMEEAEKSDRRIKRYDRLIGKISREIDDLRLKISSVSIGKEVFEKHIKMFLNNDKISIDITDDDKFKLMRDGKIAKNLSEGEKTAISFSYFLVTLDNLHEQQLLKEHIIFLDDPISSLDAQHIAQVYSIINSFFFRQRENPYNP